MRTILFVAMLMTGNAWADCAEPHSFTVRGWSHGESKQPAVDAAVKGYDKWLELAKKRCEQSSCFALYGSPIVEIAVRNPDEPSAYPMYVVKAEGPFTCIPAVPTVEK